MNITPWILGSGNAGHAAAKSLACLSTLEPELNLAPAKWLTRGESLARVTEESDRPLLIVSNPHGLHAQAILDAAGLGIKHIVSEKPACVNLAQLEQLRQIKADVAVLHVYRNMWGPRAVKAMIGAGELGDLITIEGRYWQGSTAERALNPQAQAKGWKDDIALSGPFDVYLDVASHWFDMLAFLYGETPHRIDAWLSHQNATSAHRDSHMQATAFFSADRRGFGSVSKTVHGASNHFEFSVLGTKGSATWMFENPDIITVGLGRERRTIARKALDLGSRQPAFHGTGWLEGYIEIFRQVARAMNGDHASYPKLADNLELLKVMLQADFKK